MNKNARLHFRVLPILLLLAMLAVSAQPALAETSRPQDGKYNMAVFFIAPLVDIYEGDTISLPYMVEDLSRNGGITLAPLTRGQAMVTTQIGSATVVPEGLGGTVIYTAKKAGQESVTLTVTNYFGSATGSFDFEVKPRPNYDLSILVVSEDEADAGSGFRSVFTADGEFANVPDAPLQGQGSAEAWFLLWASNEAFQCQMDPPVHGTSNFKIEGGLSPVVPLIRPPDYIDPFSLTLAFDPMPMNASSINCAGLGGMMANLAWPAFTGDPNEYNLKDMPFPGEGGIYPVSANKTWGYVMVTRKDQ